MDATSDTIVSLRSQVCCYITACAVEVYGMAKAQEAVPVQPALAAIVLLRSFWTTILRTETAKKYHRYRIYYIAPYLDFQELCKTKLRRSRWI